MNATTPIGLPVAELDTPALLVDLDLLDRNIERIAGVVIDEAGINWRPHTKGLKTPALAHKLIARGAMGVTCAKLGEAEVMASAGVKDILVANQVVGPAKTRRLAHLCRGGADVVVAVDSEIGIRQIGEAATAAGSEVRVVVELNVGMDRAGVAPGEEAARMARVAAGTPGVKLAGLMAWEGLMWLSRCCRFVVMYSPCSVHSAPGPSSSTCRSLRPIAGPVAKEMDRRPESSDW